MPLISVLLAVHDDARFIADAVRSILRQTLSDLELVVVDDASSDETPEVLKAVADGRLRVLRNEERAGLAASLNRGLELASGRYVARLDADDIAVPERLERQLERMRAEPQIAIVGSGVVDLDVGGGVGRSHFLPQDATALRWHALFSSPFFHPTVLVDREVLEKHSLRYDTAYLESEDYDLWTRLFAFADGENLHEALVLKRVHPGQASSRRSDVQASFQRQVALREIASVAPELRSEDAELAWSLGSGRNVPEKSERAGDALLELLAAFERNYGSAPGVRAAVARSLARGGLSARALRLAPWLAADVVAKRIGRRGRARRTRHALASATHERTRVSVVSPEPTPYRAPLFDRIAARPDVDLTVLYAARTVAGRTWSVEPHHRAIYLRGFRVPGARRLLRHDYPVTPGVAHALGEAQPDVVVVSGWSTFASQAALAWARAHRVPYVLLVESHDLGPRAGWRRAVKGAVVPRLLRGAASVLVVGTAARESVVARGAAPERVRIFANTIDIGAWTERAKRPTPVQPDDGLVVLSVARLVPDKGLDVLIRATAEAGPDRVRLVVAGSGPEHQRLTKLARELGVELEIKGDLPEDVLAQEYAAADLFALLSFHEPWAVVVNEAAASGLPLVLSDRVGASRDLLRHGENGFLVPAGDVTAAANALRTLVADPKARRRMSERSRELLSSWGYEPSVESFIAAVREAAAR